MTPHRVLRRPINTGLSRAARAACLLAFLAVGVGASATPALAGECPNEQLRIENNSTRLPECRAYEMVTPPYTEGYQVEGPTMISDAGSIAYLTTGSFAGNGAGAAVNRYVATRSAAGWTSTSLNPPSALFDTDLGGLGGDALSSDLRYSLWRSANRELEPLPLGEPGSVFYLHGPDGSMMRVGDPVGLAIVLGASADLRHIVFTKGNAVITVIYEFVGTGNEGPPAVVSVDNNGTVFAAGYAGMSTDGRVIVLNTGERVWARVAGSATIAVSHSECTRTAGDPGGACNAFAPAQSVGMAADGSRVYFTTAQQLVNGDTDQTNDLYECAIPPGEPAPVGEGNPCASLTEVTGNATGANVQSVVKVSPDGSHVYFTAKGVLAANLGTNDAAAVAGDENLYSYEKDAAHPAGQTTFVTKLESGVGLFPRTTADGRYLLFASTNRLVPSDTDEAQDVYRYDAQTRTMLRISTGTAGAGASQPGSEANIFFGGAPMSADGSTVVFDTTKVLSPADTDGTEDVYEWHEGQVSQVSTGGGRALGITPSGQDIFFITGRGELDRGERYLDARLNGGFPATTHPSCSGEGCQDAPAPAPQLPGISASAAFNGPGSSLTAEVPPPGETKPKPQTTAQKLAKALKACRTKHNRAKRKACEKRARTTYRRAK